MAGARPEVEEFMCKICPKVPVLSVSNLNLFSSKSRSYKTAGLFMSHLASCHSAAEGGSHICRYNIQLSLIKFVHLYWFLTRYGDNGICSACPGVGISMADYTAHCYRHHLNG